MSRLNELDVLREVCARLESVGIDYMLTGSLAMNYYAQPRMTRDIDLVVALAESDKLPLSRLFQAEYYIDPESVAEAVDSGSMFNLLHLESVVKVDMIVRKDSPYRIQEFERRQRVNIGDFQLWIVSKEDLILSKLVWASLSNSELQLNDVRNLLLTGVDEDYLQRWVGELSVTSLLEKCCEH